MASRASKYSAVASAAFDERRMERQIVGVQRVTARRHGSPPQEARLHDISIYGCRLILGEPLRADDRLWLRFGGGMPVAATVVWCDSAAAGCRFDAPIPGTLVRSMTLAQD